MAEGRFTLFGGQSPEDVRKSIGRTAAEDALSLAGVPRGRMGVAVAGLMAPFIQKTMGEKDPAVELEENRQQSSINAFARSKGNTAEYWKILSQNLNDLGDAQGAAQALGQFQELAQQHTKNEQEKRRLDITEKKNTESYLVKQDAIRFKEEALELKGELGRLKAEKDRLLAESTANLNGAKVKGLQAKIDNMEVEQKQNAVKLRQADDRITLLTDREATRKYDAKTRRMKLASDETMTRLRVSGATGKQAQKMFGQAMKGYEKAVQKNQFMDFAKELVKDDFDLAGLGGIDEAAFSELVKGEVLQSIGNATINLDTAFNYNDAVVNAFHSAIAKFTTSQPGAVFGENVELNVEQRRTGTDEDLMNKLLSQ